MAFTPGPWFKVLHEPGRWSVQDRDGGVGRCIAQEYGGSPDANADLIAAAPDLLASLLETECFVLVYCSQYAREHGLSSEIAPSPAEWHPTHKAIWDRLQAAKDKAKGAAVLPRGVEAGGR